MFLMAVLGQGCGEQGVDQIDDSAPAPAPVTIRSVVDRAGGAIVKFKIPNDENLLGVKAVYERNGTEIETSASLYLDSLVIEGIGDTGEHSADIYSVGRNGKLSDPVKIPFHPLPLAIFTAGMDMKATFGGIKMSFTNPAKDDLAFVILVDSLGTGAWEPLQTFYSKAASGKFNSGDMSVKEYKLAGYIRDRWNNQSEMIYKDLTPLQDEVIPKNKFRNAKLPGDSWRASQDREELLGLQNIWDGNEYWPDHWEGWMGSNEAPLPQHFTIDLGLRVSLSRFKLFPRDMSSVQGTSEFYHPYFPRIFEIWGSTNPPADGSFDNWVCLGRWTLFKPSGYTASGELQGVTQEDINYYCQNQVYDMEDMEDNDEFDPFMEITHLRFRTIHTIGSFGTTVTTASVMFNEITLYGNIIQK
jgi:hypothetical protein